MLPTTKKFPKKRKILALDASGVDSATIIMLAAVVTVFPPPTQMKVAENQESRTSASIQQM